MYTDIRYQRCFISTLLKKSNMLLNLETNGDNELRVIQKIAYKHVKLSQHISLHNNLLLKNIKQSEMFKQKLMLNKYKTGNVLFYLFIYILFRIR